MKTNVATKPVNVTQTSALRDVHNLKAAILKALLTVCPEDIRVSIIGSKVVLDGAVESAEHKIAAATLVRNMPDIEEVENNLRVDWIC